MKYKFTYSMLNFTFIRKHGTYFDDSETTLIADDVDLSCSLYVGILFTLNSVTQDCPNPGDK